MSDHMNDCCEYNVACDVSNCGLQCGRQALPRRPHSGQKHPGTCTCKDETFCSTFTKKGRAAF